MRQQAFGKVSPVRLLMARALTAALDRATGEEPDPAADQALDLVRMVVMAGESLTLVDDDTPPTPDPSAPNRYH